MSDTSPEQYRPKEVPHAPQQLAWQPSSSDYQSFSSNAVQQRNGANQLMIQGGVFNDVVIDFGSQSLIVQAVQYFDYPTTGTKVLAQPAIFQEPFDANKKLITGESNQPHTSQGVSRVEDAKHLVTGMTEQGQKITNDLMNFLSKPEVINESIKSLGPILDTAVNYYCDQEKVTHIQRDAGEFTAAGLKQVDQVTDRLSYPMNQNQIGHEGAALLPWFIPGLKNPVNKATALEAGGLTTEEAAKLSKSELIEKLGVSGVEWADKEYRKVFFEGHPELMPFENAIVVHHAVEQQILEKYPGLFSPKELNELGNLRGIPKELDDLLHKTQLRKQWDTFYKSHAIPTREEVVDYAKSLDSELGHNFEPPVK
jgi:hypothetical protein